MVVTQILHQMKNLVILLLGLLYISGILHSCNKDDLPVLKTAFVTNIKGTTAISGGIIIFEGTGAVIERGICWNTLQNPTIVDSTTKNGNGVGVFISLMSGLDLNTTYYVRAYAKTKSETTYGNELNFTTSATPSIGENYQGGIVAYVFQHGDPGYITGEIHGLIASPVIQSRGARWGCLGIAIPGADGTAIGTGKQNTLDIIAGCTTEVSAASLCFNLILDGYHDWYLPSRAELEILYMNSSIIGGFDPYPDDYYGPGTPSVYWSSSESVGMSNQPENENAWSISFIDGRILPLMKKNLFSVRAVRSF